MDFTVENSQQLRKMLEDRFPEQVVMNDWKNQIFEKLAANLRKEGFDEEQIRRVARSVWAALDI